MTSLQTLQLKLRPCLIEGLLKIFSFGLIILALSSLFTIIGLLVLLPVGLMFVIASIEMIGWKRQKSWLLRIKKKKWLLGKGFYPNQIELKIVQDQLLAWIGMTERNQTLPISAYGFEVQSVGLLFKRWVVLRLSPLDKVNQKPQWLHLFPSSFDLNSVDGFMNLRLLLLYQYKGRRYALD